MKVTTQFIPVMAIAGTLFVFELWESEPPPARLQSQSQSAVQPPGATAPETVASISPIAAPQPEHSQAVDPQTMASQGQTTAPNGSSPTDSSIFPDVQDDPYATAIDTAYQLGLVAGFDDGTFAPQGSLTREAATAMVIAALKQQFSLSLPNSPESLDSDPFPDVASDRWSITTIAAAKSIGIVKGNDLGEFNPAQTVSRGELMAMINGAIAYAHQQAGQTLLSSDAETVASPRFSDIENHWVAPTLGQISAFCPAILVLPASSPTFSPTLFAPDAPALRNYTTGIVVQTYECLNALNP